VTRPRFEPSTSRIRIKSVTVTTTRSVNGWDHLADLDADGRIWIKWMRSRGGLLRIWQQIHDSIEGEEFIHQMSDYQLLKRLNGKRWERTKYVRLQLILYAINLFVKYSKQRDIAIEYVNDQDWVLINYLKYRCIYSFGKPVRFNTDAFGNVAGAGEIFRDFFVILQNPIGMWREVVKLLWLLLPQCSLAETCNNVQNCILRDCTRTFIDWCRCRDCNAVRVPAVTAQLDRGLQQCAELHFSWPHRNIL
jgi:hypothetical protein